MEGKASNPAAWPEPFRLDGSKRTGMIEVGGGHFVRASGNANASELAA
jgi:peptide/nickel transport system ATP-binding protein